MHPVEAYKQKTGTGRLASLSLIGSEIIIGKDFQHNKRVNELLSDQTYNPYVLYPGKNAVFADSPEIKQIGVDKQLLIFLIDATWIMAKKMFFHSPNLQALPCLSFKKSYRSRFYIKQQPADYCLSTIESVYYLLEELKEGGQVEPQTDFSGLIFVFDKMVKFQDDCRKNRFLENASKLKEVPSCLNSRKHIDKRNPG